MQLQLAFLALAATPWVEAQSACASPSAWSLCEISIPATDPSLRAEFRGPSHRTFLIQSFTEATRQHLRIVPTEPGTWDYRLISADPAWNNKEGSFTATASDAPGYVETANVHHFRYTGSKQPHLWMGDIGNHKRIVALAANDAEVLAAHKAGVTADLVVPNDANLPDLIARYGALNITWQSRTPITDPYHHISAPANYLTYRSEDGDVPAIEHQIYQLPAVNDFGADLTDTDQFRHALWRTTMDGAYPESRAPGDAAAAQMRHWYKFMSGTRHWELEPFFDAGGRRAMALEGVEYIVYVEQPGPVEVTVEKHSYEVAWFNPVSGDLREEKKNLKTEIFSGEPPDNAHDWVLHLSREGMKAGMLKSYKFESREVLPQEIETAKVPFEIAEPRGSAISMGHPGPYSAVITKETKAAKAMRFVWTGEVTADGQPYAILGTGPRGQIVIPANLATRFPASFHLRVEGLNGVGKLYAIDRDYQLTP